MEGRGVSAQQAQRILGAARAEIKSLYRNLIRHDETYKFKEFCKGHEIAREAHGVLKKIEGEYESMDIKAYSDMVILWITLSKRLIIKYSLKKRGL